MPATRSSPPDPGLLALADKVWNDSPLGTSAGVVELEAGETPTTFVNRADTAMYDMKKAARASM
jgi:GGDEF domain-containing protein